MEGLIPAMRVFSRNHVALMIAVVYTAVIVGWIGITFIMQVVLYPVEVQDGSVFELLSYYVDHRGYIGLDHGTKGIVFLISSYVPLHFIYIHRQTEAFIGAIFGTLSMLILSLAFLVQAFTAEFLIGMLENTETTSLAVFLYKGIFLEGALTDSVYIIVNLLLACWILFHSRILNRAGHHRLYIYGITVSLIHLLASLFLFSQIIHPNEVGDWLSESATFFFIVWFLWYGFRIDQMKRQLNK